MRAALYCRVSTAEQNNENQVLQLRQFAESQGWNVVAEYKDEVSGSKSDKERPAFREMFIAASRRQFDVLLFWSLDRLSREGVLPTLQYLNRLSSHGIKWRSFTEQYIDSCGVLPTP
jgi:DNA invertase Pin-like site-specific DNA recombinase